MVKLKNDLLVLVISNSTHWCTHRYIFICLLVVIKKKHLNVVLTTSWHFCFCSSWSRCFLFLVRYDYTSLEITLKVSLGFFFSQLHKLELLIPSICCLLIIYITSFLYCLMDACTLPILNGLCGFGGDKISNGTRTTTLQILILLQICHCKLSL